MERAQFRTPAGVRVPAVTADEMRAVDRVAVEDVGLQVLQMMENAGRALAWHVREAREAPLDGPVRVLAGSGGNGGGGLACARHLANRGVQVTVALDRDPDALTGAAARQYGILEEMGVPTATGPEASDGPDGPSVLVDALVGYGLDGEVREPTRSLIQRANRQPAPTVSLDVPSGVDATTGERLGVAVDPERTVTLALPKTGLAAGTGTLFLADIGIPRTVYDRLDLAHGTPFGDRDWVELRSEGDVTR